jgi:phosphoribosylformylglycinamidine cyclo-ligase
MDYRQSGVDIDAGDKFVKNIMPLVRSTYRKEVLGDLGGFGGLFQFPKERFHDPVLVSGTDGVGTKLQIAFMMDRHTTIGEDLVAMCVNDIVVTGAEPLFFLDYVAVGKLNLSRTEAILQGIVAGCQAAGCALIGGETAEMGSLYDQDEYELAGFAVGVVEREKMIDGRAIQEGDVIIGLSSSGLHSNGYSLVRKVCFDQAHLSLTHQFSDIHQSLGDILLTPTKIYVKTVLRLVEEFSIHGIAHITGGGLSENIPRILPHGYVASIWKSSWENPTIYSHLAGLGEIPEEEMYRVFNMGIGMVLIVPASQAHNVVQRAIGLGEQAQIIGEIRTGESDRPCVKYQVSS